MKVNTLAGINKDKSQSEQRSQSPVRSTVAGITAGRGINFNISKDVMTLSFLQLCERYENNFEYDANQDEKLKDEIEKFGMQNKPIVVKIDDYLKLDNVPAKARQYYEGKRKDGFTYYILSGHRRCRAVMSLCYKNTVGLDTAEFYAWFKKTYGDFSTDRIEAENKWGVISVKTYVPDSADHEEELTQIENFSSRIIETFTWVFNAYKLLNKKEKATADDVTKFVNNKHGVELKSGHIGNYLTVIRSLDDDFINEIFAGNLTPYDAKRLTSYYKKNLVGTKGEEKRAEVLNAIRDKNIDSSEYLKSLTTSKRKKNAATTKLKKEVLNKSVVINYLKDVEAGKMNILDLIKIIEEKY